MTCRGNAENFSSIGQLVAELWSVKYWLPVLHAGHYESKSFQSGPRELKFGTYGAFGVENVPAKFQLDWSIGCRVMVA